MNGRESSLDIEKAAAAWVARMDRAPLSTEHKAQLQRWLAADVRRRGAFLRAKALWLRAESLRDSPPETTPDVAMVVAAAVPARRGRSRSRLQWCAAIAASLLLAVLLFVSVPVPTAYATAKGEMRRVPLIDGSTMTLNTQSVVKLYEHHGQLRAKVLQGEVFFETAAHAPPLRVEIDGRRFDATSASFSIRKLDDAPAQLVLQNGSVDVVENGRATPVAVNTRLSMPLGRGTIDATPLSVTDLQHELAWRDGKIAFHGESLQEAARSFSRYSDIRLVIADPALAREPVTGLFAANNPVGFARAAAAVFGAQVEQHNGAVIVRRD